MRAKSDGSGLPARNLEDVSQSPATSSRTENPTPRLLPPAGGLPPPAHPRGAARGQRGPGGRPLRRRVARRAPPPLGHAPTPPATARAREEPVLLVPGFMAGDDTLRAMSRTLRRRGFRTYRSHIHANVGCTLDAAAELETRIESIAIKRDSRVRIVGPQPGRDARPRPRRTPARPDLGHRHHGQPDAGARAPTTCCSPPGVDVLVRLSRAGVPGLMSEECVAGSCARQSFDESREPLRRRRLVHRDLLPARRHRRLAGLRRPRGARGRGDRLARRHGVRPAGDRRGHRGAAAARPYAGRPGPGSVPSGLSVLEVDRGESA